MQTDIDRRLVHVGTVDLAALFARLLAEVRNLVELGDANRAETHLEQLEDALGGDIMTCAVRISAARHCSGTFDDAVSRFRQGQSYRRRSVAYLETAILTRSHSELVRWRWSARAYRECVHAFLGEQELLGEFVAKAARVRSDAGGSDTHMFRALSANLRYRSEVFATQHRPLSSRAEQADEILALYQDARHREAKHAALMKQRDELCSRTKERFGRTAGTRAVGQLHSLASQIDGYKRILEDADGVAARKLSMLRRTRAEFDAAFERWPQIATSFAEPRKSD